MKTILAIILLAFGGLMGLSRIANWLTWTPEQWAAFTRGGTAPGVLRWLIYEAFFAAIYLGMIYWGFRLF